MGLHAGKCMRASMDGDDAKELDFIFELFTHVTRDGIHQQIAKKVVIYC